MYTEDKQFDELIDNLGLLYNKLNNSRKEKGEKEYTDLIDQIKSDKNLSFLFSDDPKVYYKCTETESCSQFHHLHKCVMNTKKYPILNRYIQLYLNRNPETINVANKYGYTALMLASSNSNTFSSEETVELLLKNNTNPNIKQRYGYTALMFAANYSGTNSTLNTIKILLEHKADINLTSETGNTALMFACKLGLTETIKLLLENKADANIQDENGKTALIHSIEKLADKKIIKLLLNNADCMLLANNKNNALCFALASGKQDIIKLILKQYKSHDLSYKVEIAGKKIDMKLIKFLYMMGYYELIPFTIANGAKKEDLIDEKLNEIMKTLN